MNLKPVIVIGYGSTDYIGTVRMMYLCGVGCVMQRTSINGGHGTLTMVSYTVRLCDSNSTYPYALIHCDTRHVVLSSRYLIVPHVYAISCRHRDSLAIIWTASSARDAGLQLAAEACGEAAARWGNAQAVTPAGNHGVCARMLVIHCA
jgi:hypothetical protein